MPIINLTLLHLSTALLPTSTPTAIPTSHHLHTHLTTTTHPKTISIYTQLEDPSIIYLLHEDSTTKNQIPITTQATIEITHKSTHRIDLDLPAQTLPLTAPVLAIGRYFIRRGQRAEFQRTFEASKAHLEAFTGPYPLVGGWVAGGEGGDREDTADTDDGAAEFVLFSGWDTVERHFTFAETEGFREFMRIKEFMEGAEIKHAVRWEGGV
ncbi:hypothetical protein ASPACDRAFT_117187 [Aspergillus aculeatus ATCC 16872]|uniref:ABM domain-containing protein n=1 Tax=Aspergillus aculeatus (strain ATCC 16872 / CBS 172.66 / WB 5094) TaxID=690307 RepID=A0A1L9WWZ5_ASPA1|nr:uncharacterized protein ASPACDRAFT_117187 [Aspergillus aculeatus ATCC 16872]OJK00751.1 hypothetical protein ASPACDRAFT_117187 [Aspergillus aculeatus ATCC 16872]